MVLEVLEVVLEVLEGVLEVLEVVLEVLEVVLEVLEVVLMFLCSFGRPRCTGQSFTTQNLFSKTFFVPS